MIEEKFIDLVKKYLKFWDKNKEIDVDENLKDLGLDSISSIQLLIEIEDTYDIIMSDEHLTDDTFSTISCLWKEVESIINGDV